MRERGESEHALADAKERSTPRGPTKFCRLVGKTMMCVLCEEGYGRPYIKSSRKFHEDDESHKDRYKCYVERFGVFREEHLLWLEDERQTYHLKQAQERIQKLNHATGLNMMDFLRTTGDLAPLKTALADLLLSLRFCHEFEAPVERSLEFKRVLVEVRKHSHFLKCLRVHGITRGILAESPDGAYTVAQLLIPYACL